MRHISRTCGYCDNYVEPPENYKGRPDEGFCYEIREGVNENDTCRGWEPRKQEED
jgi:hypothetical protein